MVRLISYPFRIGNDGSVVTLEDGIDYYADEIAMLIKTVPGERELVPEYGISDPTFAMFNKVELIEKTSLFGPPVEILDVKSKYSSEEKISISIVYDELDIVDDTEEIESDVDDFYPDEYDEENPDYNFNDSTDY